MRMHAIAATLAIIAILVACGETLPSPSVDSDDGGPSDGAPANDASSVDAPADVVESDANDAGCSTAMAPCNAIEVATVSPAAIAASTQAMIWLAANDVFALAKDGGAPVPVMTTLNAAAATGFLAMEDGNAFMSQGSGVNRCSTTSPCADNPAAPIFGLGDTGPIAVANGELYAADRAGSRKLVTCLSTQSCGSSAQVLAYLPNVATRMTLTTAYVVIGFVDGALRGYLRSDRLEAGAPVPPAFAVASDLRGLAVDGSDVYWTDATRGRISRVTMAVPTEVPVLENRKFPRAIAIDGTRHAYWVETDDDAVLRCTLPACADATVIARVRQPTDLALGDRVYVASQAVQRIYAIAP